MKEEFIRVQKGDVAAFKIVFENYFERLVNYSNTYTENIDASKDIVQEVFMKVWDKRRSIRPETFHSYLYRATHNKTLNYLRDNKKVIPIAMLEDKPEDTHEELDNQGQNAIQLRKAIENLPRKCKEIFIKTKIQGLTYRQTAQELNLSEKTIERQVGIGFKKIRKYFDLKS